MKRIFSFLVAAIAMIGLAVPVNAQQQIPVAPADSAVRVGKLANGLTYYIRHNEYPKNQVDFHIAQKVGAVQEEESQRGLAHFLEHMCFNGTKNFPGNKIVTWLETKGIKFGNDLNAYTAADRTVYRITSVPTQNENVVDSCLLILHDWASALLLEDAEIDKERGVIHEEWRLGNAMTRMIEKHGAKMYPGSRYGERLPIGLISVIDNFKYEDLRSYYHKWYRPDLQGIIVVGDIDVDQMEAKIQKLFSPIQMPENPAPFEYFPVPDNEQPIFINYADKEMPAELVWAFVKYDILPREARNTDFQYMMDYMFGVAEIMITQRLDDISMKPGAPFGNAGGGFGEFLLSSYKGSLSLQAYVNDKGSKAAMQAILTELKRIAEHGFTAGEYDRARNEYMSRLEKAYSNRDKQKHDNYAQAYIANFLDNTPISGIAYQYEKIKQAAPMLPVEAINQTMKQMIDLNGKNLIVLNLGPDKEGVKLMTEAEMLEAAMEVQSTPTEKPAEEANNLSLMSEMPKAGSIVKEAPAKFGFSEWTLSNGAKVYVKKTDFKNDEIILSASSKGGESLYGAEDHANIATFNAIWSMNGVDQLSFNDLNKFMSGKQASIGLSIDGYSEHITGKSTPKDLETMMQLLYANIVKPRNDKAGFDVAKEMIKGVLKNQVNTPNYVFQDSLARFIFSNNPKAEILGMEVIDKMNYERTLQILNERFGNAAEFNFIIAGNFDEAQLKQLVAQYIASLPSKAGKKEIAKDDNKELKQGIVKAEFEHATENNNAMLASIWSVNTIPYTAENIVKANIVGQLMSTNLTNSVREDEGAAYSPHGRALMSYSYMPELLVQAVFGIDPAKKDKVCDLTTKALEDMATEVKAEELNKIKEFLLKRIEQNEHENNYWVGAMQTLLSYNVDKASASRETINAITPESIQEFVKEIIKPGNRIQFLMLPPAK